jgi:hypothetical protein
MLSSTEWIICLLGQWGFFARVIQKQVQKYDGSNYSLSQIYSILKRNGIKLTAYRSGESEEAKYKLSELTSKRRRRRKAFAA